MSLLLIVLIVIFLIFLYVFTFLKLKKRRNRKINIVTDYRKQYLERIKIIKKDIAPKPKEKNEGYNYYVTKYNSNVDYLEKETVAENKEATIR